MVNIHHYMILIIKQPEHHPRLLLPRQQHQQPQLPMLNPLRKVLHFALSKSHICEEEISFFYSLSLSKEMMDTRVVNRSSVIFSTYVLDIYISLRVLVFFFSAFPGIFLLSLFVSSVHIHSHTFVKDCRELLLVFLSDEKSKWPSIGNHQMHASACDNIIFFPSRRLHEHNSFSKHTHTHQEMSMSRQRCRTYISKKQSIRIVACNSCRDELRGDFSKQQINFVCEEKKKPSFDRMLMRINKISFFFVSNYLSSFPSIFALL